jgi:hypothetical protein
MMTKKSKKIIVSPITIPNMEKKIDKWSPELTMYPYLRKWDEFRAIGMLPLLKQTNAL